MQTPARTDRESEQTFNRRMVAMNAPPFAEKVPSPPNRTCTICTDSFSNKPGDPELVRPCRVPCSHEICLPCLEGMFTAATEWADRLPPRCCTIIQLHAILPRLDEKVANKYRQRLQEWLTPNKVYCPSRACSAFVPEARLPLRPAPSRDTPLQQACLQIIDKASQSPTARFFRTRDLQDNLSGYLDLVSSPIDLSTMKERAFDST